MESSARISFVCSAGPSSPTSFRNRVPLAARASRPDPARSVGLGEHPNTIESNNSSVIAVQWSSTNRCADRPGVSWWMRRANIFLPVPLSPRSRTAVLGLLATLRALSRTSRIAAFSEAARASTELPRRRTSRRPPAGLFLAVFTAALGSIEESTPATTRYIFDISGVIDSLSEVNAPEDVADAREGLQVWARSALGDEQRHEEAAGYSVDSVGIDPGPGAAETRKKPSRADEGPVRDGHAVSNAG